MRRELLIQSEAKRSIVIGVLMFVLFCGSLSLAMLYTRSQQPAPPPPMQSLRVGDLTVAAPQTWTGVELTSIPDELSAISELADPEIPGRRLVIATMSSRKLTSLSQRLGQAIMTMLGDELSQRLTGVRNGRFRLGAFNGQFLVGDHAQSSDSAVHTVCVLTEDARRYWLVYLKSPLESRARLRDNKLMIDICRSAVSSFLRDAGSEDLAAAEVSFDIPAAMRARVETQGKSGQSVFLLPDSSALPTLVMRVRGTVDPGVDDPEDPLSPAMMLASLHGASITRRGGQFEVVAEEIAGLSVWRARATIGTATQLEEHVCFVRLGSGRGMMIELSRESFPLAHPHTEPSIWFTKVINAAAAAADPPPVNVDVLIERGRKIASRMREHYMEEERPGAYVLIREHDQIIAAGAYDTLPDVDDEENLPIRGRSMHRTNYGVHLEMNWRANENATAFRRVQHITQSDSQRAESQTLVQSLELVDGELACHDVSESGRVTKWRRSVPDGYLPPMVGDTWPVDLLNDADAFPAIVWQQGLDQPPWPVLVELEPTALPVAGDSVTSDTVELPKRLVRLMVRPIMQLDSEQWVFDEKGEMIRSVGVTTIELLAREKLLQLMPEFEADLDEWEKETKSDE